MKVGRGLCHYGEGMGSFLRWTPARVRARARRKISPVAKAKESSQDRMGGISGLGFRVQGWEGWGMRVGVFLGLGVIWDLHLQITEDASCTFFRLYVQAFSRFQLASSRIQGYVSCLKVNGFGV